MASATFREILRGPMSEENVELARRVFEAQARRDAALLAQLIHPEVEMELAESPFGDFVDSEPRLGREETGSAFRDWYAAFDNVHADVTELTGVGEHVIAVFTYRGTGRTSGIPVEFKDMAGLFTIREGQVVRMVWLRNRAQALEAAGLSV